MQFYFFSNEYFSDSSQMALKYLKNTEANINDILIMTGNLNIRDNSWDSLFPNYLVYIDILTDIADSLNLCTLSTTIQMPTRYIDNPNNSNSVIDLMFL